MLKKKNRIRITDLYYTSYSSHKDYIGISSAIESSLGNKGCRAINNKIHGILEDHYRVFPPLCIEQRT